MGGSYPDFFCKECGEPLIDKEAMLAVSRLFREKGSDAWYELNAEDILPAGTKCKKCGASSFDKEKDIMDVGLTPAPPTRRCCPSGLI